MAKYERGGLAFDMSHQELQERIRALSAPAYRPEPYEVSRRKLEEQLKREEEEKQLKIRHFYHAAGIQRARRILSFVFVLALVSAIFGTLMLRQSKIYVQNFANTRVKREITEQLEENNKAHNALLAQIENEHIESEALKEFGLRKPTQLQRIIVELQETDKTIYHDYGRSTLSNAAGSNSYNVLEAYMKAFLGQP